MIDRLEAYASFAGSSVFVCHPERSRGINAKRFAWNGRADRNRSALIPPLPSLVLGWSEGQKFRVVEGDEHPQNVQTSGPARTGFPTCYWSLDISAPDSLLSLGVK